MSPSTSEPKPPLNLVNAWVFALTFLTSVIVVPWYGIVHGYKAGSWAFCVFFAIANGMSITGGYHRLWAHKTYEAHWTVRLFYLIFGTMAMQNSALAWAAGHRVHHQHVDDVDEDPYSAKRGFWFSHIGWMLRDHPSGKVQKALSNVPDLKRDPWLMFQHRYYKQLTIGTNIGFPLLAGWFVGDVLGTFLLAGVLRLVWSHHVTFFINSLAHMWGTRPYTDKNTARDNPILAVITYGEGYHNFHHNFAHDYRNGVRWWQWDPTKWMIAGLQFVGLTRRLKRTPVFQIQRAMLAMQFQRAQEKLERIPSTRHWQIEQLRTRLTHEYEAFSAAVAEWARVKEQWLGEKRRAVLEHWEHASLQASLREIERSLSLQLRRMRILQAELVFAA
jgi:stearoyl-CoA desaturase (Delta-9 desaturase)